MSLYSSHLEPYIVRALQALMEGQMPRQADLEHLTGDVRASLLAMQDALREDGLQAVHKVFATLVVDRPWLGRLASMQPPAESLPDLPPRRVRFLNDSEFENRPPRQWLIPAIMPREGTAMVFGPAGCNKSFLVMAWSLCIGSGTPWLGRQVLQGPVAYISAEGSFGIGGRIKAWKTFHQFHGESGVKWFDETVVLQDAGNFKELRTALEEDFAQPPLLVVIDTLSRCSGGADENSNTEMARLIAATDILHQTYHCTVLIVHHAGKDSERGARGASALHGNTETIISVAATELGCRVTCAKQKDAARFDAFSLKLQPVQYGAGEGETSAVLVHDSADSQPALRQSESVMLALLTNAEQALTHNEWKRVGIDAGLAERTAKSAIAGLLASGRVQKDGKTYLLSPPAAEEEDETG